MLHNVFNIGDYGISSEETTPLDLLHASNANAKRVQIE